MNGYILLSKSIVESGIWSKPPLYLKVWVYLLNNANYNDYGNLKRGQLFTSIPELQRVCSYQVGYRTVTPSKKEIWGILEYLRNPSEGNSEGNTKEPMIVTTKVTHGMIVTICKYSDYQNPRFYEGNSEGNSEALTKELRRERQGNNIKKENKRINKNNNSCSSKGCRQNFIKMMTDEECSSLFDEYEDADWLIDESEEDANRKHKEVYDAYRYIVGYAMNRNWPVKGE